MKPCTLFLGLLLAAAAPMAAQYRGQEPREPSITEKIQTPAGSFLGLFASDRFHMSQSISMSYLSFGGKSAGMAMYTNSMDLRLADPLHLSADVSYMFTPKGFSLFAGNEISAFILQRAQLDYRPSENMLISLQYRQLPYDYLYNPLYGGYSAGGQLLRVSTGGLSLFP